MYDLNGMVAELSELKLIKKNTLRSDALNVLTMISIKGPKCGTSEESYLIKKILNIFAQNRPDI